MRNRCLNADSYPAQLHMPKCGEPTKSSNPSVDQSISQLIHQLIYQPQVSTRF